MWLHSNLASQLTSISTQCKTSPSLSYRRNRGGKTMDWKGRREGECKEGVGSLHKFHCLAVCLSLLVPCGLADSICICSGQQSFQMYLQCLYLLASIISTLHMISVTTVTIFFKTVPAWNSFQFQLGCFDTCFKQYAWHIGSPASCQFSHPLCYLISFPLNHLVLFNPLWYI
jgi:hypothetical protein